MIIIDSAEELKDIVYYLRSLGYVSTERDKIEEVDRIILNPSLEDFKIVENSDLVEISTLTREYVSRIYKGVKAYVKRIKEQIK